CRQLHFARRFLRFRSFPPPRRHRRCLRKISNAGARLRFVISSLPVERRVGSVPTSPPVKAEAAQQEYHDEDDQQGIRVHGHTSLDLSVGHGTGFPRLRGCSKYGSEIDAVIGSENTYPPPAT